jgi:hypothetical protein
MGYFIFGYFRKASLEWVWYHKQLWIKPVQDNLDEKRGMRNPKGENWNWEAEREGERGEEILGSKHSILSSIAYC